MNVQHSTLSNWLSKFLVGSALATLSLAAWAQTPLDPKLIPHFVDKLPLFSPKRSRGGGVYGIVNSGIAICVIYMGDENNV